MPFCARFAPRSCRSSVPNGSVGGGATFAAAISYPVKPAQNWSRMESNSPACCRHIVVTGVAGSQLMKTGDFTHDGDCW